MPGQNRIKADSVRTQRATLRKGRRRWAIEPLESRRLLSAVSWVGGSGNWSVASNWSTGVVPGPSDDVTINVAPDISITHSSGTDSVHSLTTDNPFVLSGGTLTVATTLDLGSVFTLAGGTLAGATINSAGDLAFTSSGGTLDGVTANGNLDLSQVNGATINILGNLTLNGSLLLGSADGTTSGVVQFVGNAPQTFSGTGTVLFGANASNGLFNAETGSGTAGSLALGSGIAIEGGSGTLGNIPSTATILLSDSVTADTPGGTLILTGGLVQFLTAPELGASDGGTLMVRGVFDLPASSTVNIGIGSSGAGHYDVTQGAVLAGTMNISLLSGFTPTQGATYQVGSFGSSTGSFTFTGLTAPGVVLTPAATSTALTLTVTQGAPSTTPPAKQVGGLDPTFGNNGLASHDVGLTSTVGVVVQPDGDSVIAGTAGESPNTEFGLTRYNADGTVDTSFGTSGIVTSSFGGSDAASDVALLPDGDILVAGTDTTAGGSQFVLAEYTSGGVLDSTFGGGLGYVLTSFSTTSGTLSDDVARTLAVSANGSLIYVAGSSNAAGKGLDFAVAAYNADGSLDTSFGSNGTALLDFAGGDDSINAIALQSNGDLVAAGSSTNPASGVVSVALARFLPNGSLDSHFGAKGKTTTSVRGVADVASSVAIDHTGKIVVGGLSATGSPSDGSLTSDFLVIRYTAAGAIDKTFGGGPVTTSFGQPSAVTQVLIDPDGTILASGKTIESLNGLDPSQLEVAVAQYTTNGKLNTTFNGTGTAVLDLSGDEAPQVVTADRSDFAPADLFSQFTISPQDTGSSLLAEFEQFEQSAQGTIAVTQGGELLAVGNSGANTVEAEIVTAGIDLAARLIAKLPASAVQGAKETLTVQISNGGTTTAVGTVTIQLLASPDGQLDPGLTPFFSVPEKVSLKHGQTRAFPLHYALPAVTGTFSIVVNIDSGSLTELNASNNVVASPSQVQLSAPFVQLVASDLASAGVLAANKPATITFSVADSGNIPAKSAPLEILASPDGTVANGTEIAEPKLALNLSPGAAARQFRVSFHIPATLAANSYVLVAVLDPSNTLNAPNPGEGVLVGTNVFTVG